MKEDKPNSTGTSCFISAPVEEMILTRISTDIPMSQHHYTVLQRFADSGYIRKHNLLLDYGCGKTRGFFCPGRPDVSLFGIEYE